MTIEILEGNGSVKALMAPQFNTLCENANKEIILDFTHLEYISSSGLRLLIGLRKASAAKGGKVIIEKINDTIRNVCLQ